MAKRWELQSVSRVLDVGCGIGHWGRVLLPVLPQAARIVGVDFEKKSIEKAREIAHTLGISHRLQYDVANARELPFPDNSFDMVTCQTLLIHIDDVPAALREMHRVLKPGGLLAVAEPNNAAQTLVEDSLSFDDPIEHKLARVDFALRSEWGKKVLGEGHNSVGDLIPGMMAQVGLTDVRVHLSDKPSPVVHPYSTPEERANIEQMMSWTAEGFLGFDKDVARRYFLAGGGDNESFEHHWESNRRPQYERIAQGIKNGTFHSAGGMIFYLISGRK
jgi:ubiquinone/menaquinone biosynthesis C-methylase UbiE